MTAYSSSLNLRMKELYDKNYYTPQLPMRTFRNPYFLPTSNQLLYDILNKQTATTTATAAPTTTTTSPSVPPSVPPPTTGPKRPAPTAKPKPRAKKPSGGAGKPSAAQAAKIAKNRAAADKAKAAAAAAAAAETQKQDEAARTIQNRFNKDTPQLRKEIAKRKAEEAKRKAADAAIKRQQGGKTTAGGGKVAAKVFSPPPTFTKRESLDSKLAKMEAWKESQPPDTQVPTTNKQDADLARGNKLLKDLQNAKADKKFIPLKSIPNSLTSVKSALTKTNKQKPHYNPRLSDDQQSATYRGWKRQKEDLEDAIKRLSPKAGAASKPIEKAGKQGDTTKLTDAATGTATKPRFEAGHIPSSESYPKSAYPELGRPQLKILNGLYQSWNTDQKALTDAQSASPKVIMSVKEKAKYILKKKNAIKEYKKQIVALENQGR